MSLTVQGAREARKTPVQARSTFTVEAIFEAAVQVLLELGSDRLTTTRVAARAGVSVGTLYQYYPNKQALLFAILSRHLGQVQDAVEEACTTHRGRPLPIMMEAVVTAFVDVKMRRPDVAMALYGIAAELGGAAVVRKITKRSQTALVMALQAAPSVIFEDAAFTAMMLSAAMAGSTRAVLEAGAPPRMVRQLRRELVVLCCGYLKGAAKKIALA
jgi:AcrR family transcriptional regulator